MKRIGIAAVLLATILVLAATEVALAEARGSRVAPEPTDVELPDYVQPPKYFRTLEMMLEESDRGLAPLGPPPHAVTGTREILVILVELSDAAPDPTHTTAHFFDRFFDTTAPSVRDFFTEASYGNFTYVPGTVLGWYPSTYSIADWTRAYPNKPDSRDVVEEALQDVNADFDFSPYDTNGDGTVDNEELTIFVIVSGGSGGAFHWWTDDQPTCDGKTIEGEFCATHESRHIGSYCHELGHDLGLPDLYDTDNEGTGPSEGIGQYGLMGGGSWTFSEPTSWSRIQLGWLTPTIIAGTSCLDIHSLETHAEAYILADPAHSTTEYFLVENRYPPDSYYETVGAPIAPDGRYPDSGLVIYHIDDAKAHDWIEHGINNSNADETHKTVDVETAEHPTSHVVNADDLDAEINRGDTDDLWDSGEYDFHDSSVPCNSTWYGGGANQIAVRQVSATGSTMHACLSISNSPPVAVCQPCSVSADGNCSGTFRASDIDGGSNDPDGAADIASICITAVDGTPVGCLDEVNVLGQGDHTLTLTITDLAGESDACDAEVIVGNQPPVARCRTYSGDADTDCCLDVSVDDVNNSSYDPEGYLDHLYISAVDGIPTGDLTDVLVCGQGSHTVTLKAIDACGDVSTCNATVEVVNRPPVAVCQAFSAEADDNCCIMVHLADIDGGTYDPDGAGDIESLCITAVDGTDVGCVDSVLVCGEAGHAVTITATDWCGERSSCNAAVTVIDVTPPEITVTLDRDVLWPPNHKMADITATVEVSDNCDADPAWVLVSITSDEPQNGTGDGDTPNDWQGADFGTPDVAFKLRSERAGGGDGRVYTITYTATDNAGNTANGTAYVRVPHDQGGSALASLGFSTDGTSLDASAELFALVVPSTAGFDATGIDVARAYVGNLKGVLVPASHLDYDANEDGITDLVLWYSVADAEMLFGHTVANADNPWVSVAFDPEIPDLPPDPADLLAGFGPVGLHYAGPGNVDYLVPNIFQLGVPVMLEIARNATSGVAGPGDSVTRLLVTPNPSSGSVEIVFNVALPGPASLRIYSARGTLVRTLEDRDITAGVHHAIWNGRDSGGEQVAAGIYFARLNSTSGRLTQKILLLQ